MTEAQAQVNDIVNATKDLMEKIMPETPAPAKKRGKAPKSEPVASPEALGAEAPAKAPKAPKAEKPAKPEKPAPVLFHGIEVAADADLKALEADLAAVREATEAIARKDADLLGSYLAIGKSAARIAPMFKSTKLYGQFLAKEVPASQALDAALRSNCKWLFEALNDEAHEASDLLTVLGVNRIEDYKSGNPTVIRRQYKEAKEKAEKLAKAKEMGIESEDEEEALGRLKAEEKAAKEANEAAARKAMRSSITAFVNAMEKAGLVTAEAAGSINNVIVSSLEDPLDDTISLIQQYTKAIRSEAKAKAKAEAEAQAEVA